MCVFLLDPLIVLATTRSDLTVLRTTCIIIDRERLSEYITGVMTDDAPGIDQTHLVSYNSVILYREVVLFSEVETTDYWDLEKNCCL